MSAQNLTDEGREMRAVHRVQHAKLALAAAESELIAAERDLRNVNGGSAYAAAMARARQPQP